MNFLRLALLFLLLFWVNISISQSKNSDKQFGISTGAVVPINYFGAGPLELINSNSQITLSSKIGYNFGMMIKTNYGKRFSIENGINFLRRNFDLSGSSSFNGVFFKDNADFGYVSYSFPTKGIVYIQLSSKSLLNTSVGASIDFYASAVNSKGENDIIFQYSERAKWINGSILADLGVEWRDTDYGTFYFGVGVNIPITTIAVTNMKYYYDKSDITKNDIYAPVFLNGNFFNIKIKYYLAENN